MLNLTNINFVLLLSAATLVCGQEDLERIESLSEIIVQKAGSSVDSSEADNQTFLLKNSEQNRTTGAQLETISAEEPTDDAGTENLAEQNHNETSSSMDSVAGQPLKNSDRKKLLTIGKYTLGIVGVGTIAVVVGGIIRFLIKNSSKTTSDPIKTQNNKIVADSIGECVNNLIKDLESKIEQMTNLDNSEKEAFKDYLKKTRERFDRKLSEFTLIKYVTFDKALDGGESLSNWPEKTTNFSNDENCKKLVGLQQSLVDIKKCLSSYGQAHDCDKNTMSAELLDQPAKDITIKQLQDCYQTETVNSQPQRPKAFRELGQLLRGKRGVFFGKLDIIPTEFNARQDAVKELFASAGMDETEMNTLVKVVDEKIEILESVSDLDESFISELKRIIKKIEVVAQFTQPTDLFPQPIMPESPEILPPAPQPAAQKCVTKINSQTTLTKLKRAIQNNSVDVKKLVEKYNQRCPNLPVIATLKNEDSPDLEIDITKLSDKERGVINVAANILNQRTEQLLNTYASLSQPAANYLIDCIIPHLFEPKTS